MSPIVGDLELLQQVDQSVSDAAILAVVVLVLFALVAVVTARRKP